ncbi:MAG: CoB--CoM heterodisulfide reductase iron-sulfur subunit A family protein [Deltaproteobacteria bacterium]|nr:CoB--CoM heterodisulfide reductase iron-sulfur subunit A family protein [Deltaproteobacteria bacterium]
MPSNISGSYDYDVIIVGGGIAGMQASLDLADQGFKVAIMESDASIGGKMIRLDKVFPTLDCASCITTPKMAAVAHHRNISIITMCDLQSVEKSNGLFKTKFIQRPRYVNTHLCIGCRQCEYACPVLVPDEEQRGLSARKAIYIPFSNAIPQIALLDVESCTLCGKCSRVCPTHAVDYFQQPESLELKAKAVILATGYQLLEEFPKRAYGEAADNPNVINALHLERIIAPTGPYMRILRPGDGKEPEKLAFILCAGSRDETLGVPYCSRVCCMYSIKNALLIRHELPNIQISIFYIDLRAFGKNYEQFLRKAKEEGIRFVKAKPTIKVSTPGQGVILRYEDQEGTEGMAEEEFDLAVLSLAVIPAWSPEGRVAVAMDEYGFMAPDSPKAAPTLTEMEGVFIAGMASGPKDIVDTIIEAGAAAMEASDYIKKLDKDISLAA